MCLLGFFLLFLTTQAQLHKTVNSPWTADEKRRQPILCLLSPWLISKTVSLQFFLSIFSPKGGEKQNGRGDDGECRRKEKWAKKLRAGLERAGRSSEGLKQSADSPRFIHSFCFLRSSFVFVSLTI